MLVRFTDCDALHDLVSFVQFKKREKHPWRKPATLPKVRLHPPQPPNRINGTESRKTPHTWSGTHAAKQMQACNAAGEGIR